MVKNEGVLLLKIAELGALKHQIFTSTNKIAKVLGCSQQTASRLLRRLQLQGYIERRMDYRGEYISISETGLEELKKMHTTLESIFRSSSTSLTIRGKLFTGFGEGGYYITRSGYLKQLINKLGYKPYPGTLNLKILTPKDQAARRELENMPGAIIEGFSDGKRNYGTIKCVTILINDKLEGTALLIQRTHYSSSVLEIISPVYLRNTLKLKDDDLVTIRHKILR